MKRVVVTGAANGIGRAVALRLLADGYAVTAVDIDDHSLAELRHRTADRMHVTRRDITDPAAVAELFAGLAEAPLYGLVNNAGIYLGKGLDGYSAQDIERVLRVNTFGAVLMSKHFGELMARSRAPGAIVNIGSSSMYGGSDPVYSATKAALVGLTKACAKTLAPMVRVNLVAPGIVETGMFTSLPPDVVAWYRSAELIKSPLVADDVASSVAFLMGDDAKNYTGAVFDLNNGFHL